MNNFKAQLDNKLKSGIVTEYSNFQNIFIQVLNNHAPAEKKNCTIIVFSSLRHRSRLKNTYSKKQMIKIGKIIRRKKYLYIPS